MRRWALLLALAGMAADAPAAKADLSLELAPGAEGRLNAEAAFLAALLREGGAVYFKLPPEALPSRDAQGRGRAEPLAAALGSHGPLALRGDAAKARAGAEIPGLGALKGEDEGRWLMASGLPQVLLLENSSSVAPLSVGLAAWRWPHRKASFSEVEADPGRWLDPAQLDLVVFSSPGWWEDFANPPGGPSRMPPKVLGALRDFVRQGGAAVFIDIAQWDLEKAWPKSVGLAPLGPYAVSKLELRGGPKGGLSLAPVGVGVDRLMAAGAFDLGGSDSFDYPDGGQRPLYAAFGIPDPSGGQGWVAGLAFHVFEQDDSLALGARRLLLNLLLLAGNRRLATQGEPKAPTPAAATATRTPQRSATPTPSPAPPSPTPAPTPVVTAPPSPLPTQAPTPLPSHLPTSVPTSAPTPVPTMAPPPPTPRPTPWRPTPAPTLRPTSAPPTRPTLAPTAVLPTLAPTPMPTAVPSTPRPSAPSPVPTLSPPTLRPTPVPARPAPTPVPTRPRPTLVPTRAWSTPVPTWTRPTALPTWAPPTAVPTLARPTAVPTLARSAAIALQPWPSPRSTPPRRAPSLPTLRPTATRQPTRVPRPPVTPTPWVEASPRPTAQLTESVRNALGCLSSSPEPFGEGGVYLRFCLRHDAVVRIEVSDQKGGSLWRSEPRSLRTGDHQWFFDGRVNGVELPPGAYLFDVQARYGSGQAENRQGRLSRARPRRR